MKISTKGRYALRLMLDLAVHGGDGLPVSLKDVSRRQQLSDKYLEQIVTPLSKAGLVRSMRGAGGGYLLTRRPEEYTVGEILRPLEGDLAPVECATDADFCERCGECVTAVRGPSGRAPDRLRKTRKGLHGMNAQSLSALWVRITSAPAPGGGESPAGW